MANKGMACSDPEPISPRSEAVPIAISDKGHCPMKPDILLVEPMMAVFENQLDELYTVHRLFDAAQGQSIEEALPKIRAVVTGGGAGLSNEWIEKLPGLGVIAVNGVGTDRIDLKFARARNIDVAITAGVLTDDVADLGIALLLDLLRHVAKGDAYVRAGKWGSQAFPLGTAPKG
jgi:lactate dehydrogenase-like 2-hydroxyacid dehydrogenase